jgi:hypothetical protein
MLLRDGGLLKPFISPELARYPDEAKTKAGRRAFIGQPTVKRHWLQHTDDCALRGTEKFSRSVAVAEYEKAEDKWTQLVRSITRR